jgi:sorbitol-specific phosphotransferase system component IIA
MSLRKPSFIKTHELAHRTVTKIACRMAVMREEEVVIFFYEASCKKYRSYAVDWKKAENRGVSPPRALLQEFYSM